MPSLRSPADQWRHFKRDWWALLRRAWTKSGEDNLGLIAAGTAFYAFSSIAPVLAATVLTYGLVAEPQTVQDNIRALFATLPQEAARLISDQLDTVVSGSEGKQGLGLIVALALALYGGTKASSSMMVALNVAFAEKEKRGLIHSNLVALALVAGGIVLMLAGVASSTVTAFLEDLIPGTPAIVRTAIGLSSYVLLTLLAITGASLLFRFGPDRAHVPFSWGTPGAVLATLVWLAASVGFGFYVSNFTDYGATYGSLSAIVVLLTWLWLSVYAFLLGAELDDGLAYDHPAADAPQAPLAEGAARASAPRDHAITAGAKPGVIAGAALGLLGIGMLLVRRGR